MTRNDYFDSLQCQKQYHHIETQYGQGAKCPANYPKQSKQTEDTGNKFLKQ